MLSPAADNEPLDTWDEEETILTPDPDEEVNKYCSRNGKFLNFYLPSSGNGCGG